jgi:hypothetical protein
MCLWIESDQEKNEKDLNKWFGSRKKFAYVYKILKKYPDEDFYRSKHYQHFIWNFKKQKVYEVVRDLKPTENELKRRYINFGLHVYTDLETLKVYPDPDEVVVKFRVKREDIVAIQNHCIYDKYKLNELVCTKLEFVKVLEN